MKKTKMKRGRGGLIAFLAAGVLMLNVVPARAEEGPWWEPIIPIIPVVWEILRDAIESEPGGTGGGGGSEKIPCWSRAKNDPSEFYVDCSTCHRELGVAKGVGHMCSRDK